MARFSSQHRVVFVFRHHPVDYSGVVIIFFFLFVFSLFILDYAHFTPGPPAAKGTAPANRFIFRVKNTRAVTAAGRALQQGVFFDAPPIPTLFHHYSHLRFLFRSLLFRFDGRCRSTTAAGTRTRQEKKKCIFYIKKHSTTPPTSDDHRI